MKFYLLNVFGRHPQSGNQLAVVLVDKELSDAEMMAHCLNFNFSETVFLRDHQHMRIFSPGGELPFAGHPTIGTGWLVSHLKKTSSFNLETRRGGVPITARPDGADLVFPGEASVNPFNGPLNEVLAAANLSRDEVDAASVRVVNSGPEFVLIPVKTHAALKHARSPKGLAQKVRVYAVHEAAPDKMHVRMFSPHLGIGEDPATGSAACALAGYLKKVADRPAGKVTLFQGDEINRPCSIELQWGKQIHLGGTVNLWGQGELVSLRR